MNGLLVGNRYDCQQNDNGKGYGKHISISGGPYCNQNTEDFLGCIGSGRKRVGGEDGETDCLTDRLVRRVCCGQWSPDEPMTQRARRLIVTLPPHDFSLIVFRG